MPWLALALALLLALVHLFAGRLRFLHATPRSRWLSFSGGASVAYVFVHIFPQLDHGRRTLAHAPTGVLPFAEHHVYLVALLGFTVFYGLERLAWRSRQHAAARRRLPALAQPTSPPVFWVHLTAFALYDGLIGYLLLHRETPVSGSSATRSLLLFGAAMFLHFLVTDHGLWEHHQDAYRRRGRWILAASVLAGWSAGAALPVHPALVAALYAFLAGAIILNVIKEELPAERSSRFWAFALGAAAYTALLLLAAAE